MQKRGKIVHGENFAVVRDTYPVHPLTVKEVENKTQKELFEKRKLGNITDFEK